MEDERELMADEKLVQGTLEKIGAFGDGPLEFETRDIEALCNLAKKSLAKEESE